MTFQLKVVRTLSIQIVTNSSSLYNIMVKILRSLNKSQAPCQVIMTLRKQKTVTPTLKLSSVEMFLRSLVKSYTKSHVHAIMSVTKSKFPNFPPSPIMRSFYLKVPTRLQIRHHYFHIKYFFFVNTTP